jgi:hypothetical protein
VPAIQSSPAYKSLAPAACRNCGGSFTPSWLAYVYGGGIIFLLFDTAGIPWSGLFAGVVMLAVPVAAIRQQVLQYRAGRNKP